MAAKFSREDTLILLDSLGISLPPTNKLSLEDLNKRLKDALDAAQRFQTVIDTLPLNPFEHPLWPADKDLGDATHKFNFKEAMQMRISGDTFSKVSSNKKDTFMEMRKIVAGISQNLAKAGEFCMSDSLGELVNWGVYVKVIQIHCIKDTPVYILLYKEVIPPKGQTLHDALENIVGAKYRPIVNIQTTEFERHAMLKLFRINAKRLSPDFHPADEQSSSKIGLKTSFVLPLRSLNVRDIGRLTSIAGCEVCGKTNVSRCVQCLTIAYCSKECQKQDWPNHKISCRSLKGGTWRTITFEIPNIALLNHRDQISEASKATPGVPPDIHDGKIFLVKFQISLFQFKDEAQMLIYDRQRSFKAVWRRKLEQDLFDEGEDSMGDNLRMYRWARRVGDYQLSVCFDRPPVKDPVW